MAIYLVFFLTLTWSSVVYELVTAAPVTTEPYSFEELRRSFLTLDSDRTKFDVTIRQLGDPRLRYEYFFDMVIPVSETVKIKEKDPEWKEWYDRMNKLRDMIKGARLQQVKAFRKIKAILKKEGNLDLDELLQIQKLQKNIDTEDETIRLYFGICSKSEDTEPTIFNPTRYTDTVRNDGGRSRVTY